MRPFSRYFLRINQYLKMDNQHTPVITEDAAALASQILGLKKAAAANRNGASASKNNKPKKSGAAAPHSLVMERSFDGTAGEQQNHDGQQMGTRSSSHGRLPTSQQPRQGSRGSKQRKSIQGNSINQRDEAPISSVNLLGPLNTSKGYNQGDGRSEVVPLSRPRCRRKFNALLQPRRSTPWSSQVIESQGSGKLNYLDLATTAAQRGSRPAIYLVYFESALSGLKFTEHMLILSVPRAFLIQGEVNDLSFDGPHANVMGDYNLQALMVEQKRSKARLRELQKHAAETKRSNSTQPQRPTVNQLQQNVEEQQIRQLQMPPSSKQQQKRLESGTTRKSLQQPPQVYQHQHFQIYDQQVAMSHNGPLPGQQPLTRESNQNIGNFFKHQGAAPQKFTQQQSNRKSSSTGRQGALSNNSAQKSMSSKARAIPQGNGLIKEHTTNNILGIVAAQSMRYHSNQGRQSESTPMLNNVSFSSQQQPVPGQPLRNSQDLYKIYMNYQPQAPGIAPQSTGSLHSQPTPLNKRILINLFY